MLILGRKLNEEIVIDGKIFIRVLRIENDAIKLGIQAPAEVSVHRKEIYDNIQRNKPAGAKTSSPTVISPPDVAVITPASGEEAK